MWSVATTIHKQIRTGPKVYTNNPEFPVPEYPPQISRMIITSAKAENDVTRGIKKVVPLEMVVPRAIMIIFQYGFVMYCLKVREDSMDAERLQKPAVEEHDVRQWHNFMTN